jgi:hypothetical protein
MGRPRSGSGAVPTRLTINGTVGGTLIDAVVRAHGSSQLKAQPSKAMPMGPVTAHMSNATRISPRRHDIMAIISRNLNVFCPSLRSVCIRRNRNHVTASVRRLLLRIDASFSLPLPAGLPRWVCERASSLRVVGATYFGAGHSRATIVLMLCELERSTRASRVPDTGQRFWSTFASAARARRRLTIRRPKCPRAEVR